MRFVARLGERTAAENNDALVVLVVAWCAYLDWRRTLDTSGGRSWGIGTEVGSESSDVDVKSGIGTRLGVRLYNTFGRKAR